MLSRILQETVQIFIEEWHLLIISLTCRSNFSTGICKVRYPLAMITPSTIFKISSKFLTAKKWVGWGNRGGFVYLQQFVSLPGVWSIKMPSLLEFPWFLKYQTAFLHSANILILFLQLQWLSVCVFLFRTVLYCVMQTNKLLSLPNIVSVSYFSLKSFLQRSFIF